MRLRSLMLLMAIALIAGACSDQFGLGEPACETEVRDPSGANLLYLQAVPTARYTPCVEALRFGWENVELFAENGAGGFHISRFDRRFLSATVTASCDVDDAVPVASGYPDIERYEDVTFQQAAIGVTIVPSGDRPLIQAKMLAKEYEDVDIDDRPIVFTVDDHLDQPVGSRVNLALLRDQYVWIIEELDVEERTLELRTSAPGPSLPSITPHDALEHIEDTVADVFYRGFWYFTFEGGCITYEFNTKGRLAETIAVDAEESLGFYPAYQLREIGEDLGYYFGADPDTPDS